MNGAELSARMGAIVDRLEREPRYSLAFVLAYDFVMTRISYLPAEEWEAAIEAATSALIDEVRKCNGLARIRRHSRGMAALMDRLGKIARGETVPDKRRRRKRRRAKALA